MKTIHLLVIVWLSSCVLAAQTVVRMRMPVQSEKALNVVALYNEALPTGFTIVLGVVGYDISGGAAPYQYEWLKNNQLITTGEVAVIVPEVGSKYVLRVKDKNMCVVENAINVSASSKISKNYLSETVKVNLLQFSHQLNIEFKGFVPENTVMSIFDLQGKLQQKENLKGNTTLSVQLPNGIFLVVVGNGEMYHVQKISVNQ